jgi:hypothetical protein
MKVYVVLKQTYAYWDNDHCCNMNVFKDRQSAVNFLQMLKEDILLDAMSELNVSTIKEIEELFHDNESIWGFSNEPDYFYIEIEEWGYEMLDIEEHDVMKFEL